MLEKKKKSLRDAFTLLEVLVVVAISAAISVGGFLMFSQYRRDQNVKLTLNEISSAIRDAQRRSVTQENGRQWGIRFVNGDSDTYQMWSGLTYASGTIDQKYSLRRGVQFGNPPEGFTFDLIFKAISGILGEKRVLSITSGANSLVGDIVINLFGKTTARIERGLVGYWHFDEGTSTIAYDASGNGNNGTLINGPVWQSGSSCKAGGCLSFNGSNAYTNASSSSSLNAQNITLMAWLKPNVNNVGGAVIERYATYGIRLSGGKMNFVATTVNKGWSFAAMSSNTALTQGNWYFLAITYDGTTARYYVNGQPDGTDTSRTGNLVNGTQSLFIGRDSNNVYTNGIIDEVRIYNRALSAQEVWDIYNDLK